MYYSQKDSSYSKINLGKSKLTIGGFGCFLCSLSTLYQKHPLEIAKIPGAVTDSGLVVSSVIAKSQGGLSLPITKTAPKGWCIAMTSDYAKQGFPTHFFCVNMDTKQQIDPLDLPACVEPLTYKIAEYRPFSGIKLNTEVRMSPSVMARLLARLRR